MSMRNRRYALLGWIVWKIARRRMRRAVPEWPRRHPLAVVAGVSGALVAIGSAAALLGGGRRAPRLARRLDERI